VFQYISLAGAAAYVRLHRQASLAGARDLAAGPVGRLDGAGAG
jgi:hypothetical protein